jgi:hypothetical protein
VWSVIAIRLLSQDQAGTPLTPITRQAPWPGVISLPVGVISLIPPQSEKRASPSSVDRTGTDQRLSADRRHRH